MHVKYVVELTEAERESLETFVNRGSKLARKVERAQVLLAADEGYQNKEIAALVGVGTRAKKRFVERPFEVVLHDESRPGESRRLTGKEEALLVATACSKPPDGRARWTMQLLADAFVSMTDHTSLSDETVRRRLREKKIKPWQHKMRCIPNVDAEYVVRMEDVLDLYSEDATHDEPVLITQPARNRPRTPQQGCAPTAGHSGPGLDHGDEAHGCESLRGRQLAIDSEQGLRHQGERELPLDVAARALGELGAQRGV
ncbi:MAG: hypothetical protein CMN31_28675 [Sandaracinus sp.]|nr:hypothetical protein [Sandaracinus sp.]MBJ75260.1 hypothetical protein [Sandaracinus sp.]